MYVVVDLRAWESHRYCSYHSGVNATGLNWKQATPHFNETHLKAYVDFISTVFRKYFPHTSEDSMFNINVCNFKYSTAHQEDTCT